MYTKKLKLELFKNKQINYATYYYASEKKIKVSTTAKRKLLQEKKMIV